MGRDREECGSLWHARLGSRRLRGPALTIERTYALRLAFHHSSSALWTCAVFQGHLFIIQAWWERNRRCICFHMEFEAGKHMTVWSTRIWMSGLFVKGRAGQPEVPHWPCGVEGEVEPGAIEALFQTAKSCDRETRDYGRRCHPVNGGRPR